MSEVIDLIPGDWWIHEDPPKVKSDMFSEELPGLQLVWDATSFKQFQFCPRSYQYAIISGFRPRNESKHLTFGRHFHTALEAFDGAMALGVHWEDARRLALDVALKVTKGWESRDKDKNRFTLIRSVDWYCQHYGPDNPVKILLLPSGKPAIEVSFRIMTLMLASTGEDFALAGHIDALVSFIGNYYAMERKTTGKAINTTWFGTFDPDIQIELYNWAGGTLLEQNLSGVLLDGTQVLVNSNSFGRHIIMKTRAQVNETFQDIASILLSADRYAQEEYWPKYTRNCWACPYSAVCSNQPSIRDQQLREDFHFDRWDPTIPR